MPSLGPIYGGTGAPSCVDFREIVKGYYLTLARNAVVRQPFSKSWRVQHTPLSRNYYGRKEKTW